MRKPTTKPKSRGRRPQIEYIEYDEAKRHEFITGFHKRKVENHKKKVQKAKNRDKEEKLVNIRRKQKIIDEAKKRVDEIDAISKIEAIETFGEITVDVSNVV